MYNLGLWFSPQGLECAERALRARQLFCIRGKQYTINNNSVHLTGGVEILFCLGFVGVIMLEIVFEFLRNDLGHEMRQQQDPAEGHEGPVKFRFNSRKLIHCPWNSSLVRETSLLYVVACLQNQKNNVNKRHVMCFDMLVFSANQSITVTSTVLQF